MKNGKKLRLFVSVLEPSSNRHLEAILPYLENVELVGIYDSRFGNPTYNLDDFSVMGFADVFKKIGFFIRVKNEMAKLALSCDKVLLMDSSAFNIPLAKQIKRMDSAKEIIYYILPQVWAWKPWRARALEKYCDKLCAILPYIKKSCCFFHIFILLCNFIFNLLLMKLKHL